MIEETKRSTPSLGAWWAVFVLFLAYTFAYIDRTILALFVDPIKQDLQINDTQFSLINGLAFAIFYATAAIPIAWLADRKSRRVIISVGIAVWSISTALCGLARNFLHLFLARVGVGAGEAALLPAGISLLADIFPKELRGFAFGLFGSAIYVGTGLAFIAGGVAIEWVNHMQVPAWLGTFSGWQLVLIVVGLPGLLIAALTLTIPEPRSRAIPEASVPSSTILQFMRGNVLLLVLLLTAVCCTSLLTAGFNTWGPAFYMRTYHLTPREVGLTLGVITLIFGPCGAVCGGWLVRYLTRRGYDDAPIRVFLLATFFLVPVKILSPLMPTWESALSIWVLAVFFGPFPFLTGSASLQLIAPPHLRAQLTALSNFVLVLLALILGPTIIALFTDFLFRDDDAVGKSLALTAAIFGPIAITLTAIALPIYARTVRKLGHGQQGTV